MAEYINVDQQVYNNTRMQVDNARRQRRETENAVKAAEERLRQAERDLREINNTGSREIQNLVKEQERMLSAQIDDLDENIRLELGRQNVRLRKQLDELRSEMRSSNQRMDDVESRLQKITADFNTSIRAITQRIERQRDRAQFFANQVDAILRAIDLLHPDKLTPGRAEQLHERRNFIATNITNGDYEAAIGLAQESIVDGVALQSELEQLNEEYNRLAVEIARAILGIERQIQDLSNNRAHTHETTLGAEPFEYQYTYDGDLNYWSSGLFAALQTRFDDERNRVNQEFVREMDLENMRIAVSSLPRYTDRLSQCEMVANSEFSISCGIQNLAERIYDSLTNDDSWIMQTSGFENDDYRRSYAFSFSDGFQNTVSVVLIPVRPGGSKSEIQFFVQAYDGERTISPGDCAVIRRAVLARLASSGIEIGDINRSDEYRQAPDPQTFLAASYEEGAEVKEGRLERARQRLSI